MTVFNDRFDSIGCVIMASGKSERFGSNKLLAEFHGKPLFHHALDLTGELRHRIVVTRHTAVSQEAENRGIAFLLHDLPNRNDTVRLGLSELLSTQGCFFLPSDQPLLSIETFRALCEHALAQPDRIWRPAFGDRHGSPVYFPSFLYDELLHLPEKKGGGFVLKQHPELLCTVQCSQECELMDADTPEDLEVLAAIHK